MEHNELWGKYLRLYREKAGHTQESLADHVKVSKSSVRGWESGNTPNDKSLALLLAYLYDASVADEWGAKGEAVAAETGAEQSDLETSEAGLSATGKAILRAGKVWTNPDEVRFWLALIEKDTEIEKLELDRNIKKWLRPARDKAVLYKPPRLPEHYIRTGQHAELLAGLIDHEEFSRPRYRVFVLYGSPGCGKTMLATAVGQERLVVHFFWSGIWFLTEAVLSSLLQGDVVSSELARTWQNWLAGSEIGGLVVIDDLTDGQKLARLLQRAGPRVSVAVTVQNPDTAQSGLGAVTPEEVAWFSVQGFDQAESEAFLSRLWDRPLRDEDRRYVGQVIQHLNRPESLRLIAGLVAEAGWEKVWEWLYRGQDADTPLLQLWAGLLKLAWQRTSGREQEWLKQLAGASSQGSHFGEPFATTIWQCSREQGLDWLEVLARRGWLEVIAVQPETELDLVLGRQYRLVREGWAYILHNHSRPATWGQRLKWAFQIRQKLATRMGVRWWTIWVETWHALKTGDDMIEPILKRPDILSMFLQKIWEQRGLWPPAEISLLYIIGQWGYYIRFIKYLAILNVTLLAAIGLVWIIKSQMTEALSGQGMFYINTAIFLLMIYAGLILIYNWVYEFMLAVVRTAERPLITNQQLSIGPDEDLPGGGAG